MPEDSRSRRPLLGRLRRGARPRHGSWVTARGPARHTFAICLIALLPLALLVADDAGVARAVRGYVSAVVPGCSPDRITHVRRLPPGENHAVYAVSLLGVDPNRVVVRIATSERARDCATAEREAEVLTLVHGVSAPSLYDFRCASGWFDVPTMCMQFVEGDQRPPRDADEVMRLGSAVGGLHALPSEHLTGWSDTKITLEAYLEARVTKIGEKLRFVRDPLPAAAQLRLRRVGISVEELLGRPEIRAAFESRDRLVLLHGDVAGRNIVWTPAPVLIDWEYARVGDAADEIAYVFNQNDDLDESLRVHFWRGYAAGRGGDASSALLERVTWWEPVTVLGSALFWAQSWVRRAIADEAGDTDGGAPREQGYYLEHTMRRVERAELLLHQLGLDSWRR
jgi:aminoglycoside phosphotransferase (APT) family kinase protein